MEAAEKILGKLPIIPLILLYCGYLGFDYYNWLNAPNSQLGQRRNALKSTKQNLETNKAKLKQAEEFYKTLDAARERIRTLTTQLENSKAEVSTEVDISNFVRMVSLEAKKLRLTIKGIKPETEVKKEYYVEVPFNVHFRGAYVQFLLFLDAITRLHQVVRIGDFNLKPTGSVHTKYVELEGNVVLITYKYLGTHADEVIHKPEMKNNSASATPSTPPATPSPKPSSGGKK